MNEVRRSRDGGQGEVVSELFGAENDENEKCLSLSGLEGPRATLAFRMANKVRYRDDDQS